MVAGANQSNSAHRHGQAFAAFDAGRRHLPGFPPALAVSTAPVVAAVGRSSGYTSPQRPLLRQPFFDKGGAEPRQAVGNARQAAKAEPARRLAVSAGRHCVADRLLDPVHPRNPSFVAQKMRHDLELRTEIQSRFVS